MAEFLAGTLERVLSGMLEDSYYFRAAWYPGEGDSYILGLLLESLCRSGVGAGVKVGVHLAIVQAGQVGEAGRPFSAIRR